MSQLARVFNIADVEEQARGRLPRGIYEFIARGAEDDEAIKNNREAFRRLKLQTNVLVDVSPRSTETVLFGRTQAMPLAIAPTGAAGLVWCQGELELARAAAAAKIPFTLATRAMTSIEDIAEKAGGMLWFQLYLWADRTLSFQMVERAKTAGFEALLVTVDVPVDPNREFNRRNGFALPFKPAGRALYDILAHPHWLLNVMGRYMMTTGMPRYEHQGDRARITQGGGPRASMCQDNVTWEDIRELRRRWPRILMVKGILSAEDARRAVGCGADAVVVSNHGGRCLDAAVAPMDVLPDIVDAVGHRATVLVDSGVRRGSDIVKALALGASAVLSGRPTLYGLSLAGQTGARKVLSIFHDEMLTAMGQVGRPTTGELAPDIVHGARARIVHVTEDPIRAPMALEKA